MSERMKDVIFFGLFVVLVCVAATLACHIHMNKANAATTTAELAQKQEEVQYDVGYFNPATDLSLADYREFEEAAVVASLDSYQQESNSSDKPKKEKREFESEFPLESEPEFVSNPGPEPESEHEPEPEPESETEVAYGAKVVESKTIVDEVVEVPEWWYDESTREATLTAWAAEGLLTLDWVKAHLLLFYTAEEIRQTTLIVMAEDLVAYSDTVWSAHVWVILGRVGTTGFANNGSIIGILSAKNQFSTYNSENLSKEPNPDVEWIVRDVFARKILEDYGLPEEVVGRTMPKTHLFFDDRDSNHFYNEFYRYCWGDIYDPFDSPYNPYDN